MKIVTKTELVDVDGNKITQRFKDLKRDEKGDIIYKEDGSVEHEFTTKNVTIGDIIRGAIEHKREEDTEEDLIKKFDIIRRLFGKDEIELDATDIDMIKRNIIGRYEPFVAGQSLSILNSLK